MGRDFSLPINYLLLSFSIVCCLVKNVYCLKHISFISSNATCKAISTCHGSVACNRDSNNSVHKLNRNTDEAILGYVIGRNNLKLNSVYISSVNLDRNAINVCAVENENGN